LIFHVDGILRICAFERFIALALVNTCINVDVLFRIIVGRPLRSHRTSNFYAVYYYREIINGYYWMRLSKLIVKHVCYDWVLDYCEFVENLELAFYSVDMFFDIVLISIIHHAEVLYKSS